MMAPFATLFPDLAVDECRTVRPVKHPSLPNDEYAFYEMYCVVPGCDCRRVLLQVIARSSRQPLATIGHGFDEESGSATVPRTHLDPMQPQSKHAEALLTLFEELLVPDDAYMARLQRHYRMFKRVVDDPSHPDHTKLAPQSGAVRGPNMRPSPLDAQPPRGNASKGDKAHKSAKNPKPAKRRLKRH